MKINKYTVLIIALSVIVLIAGCKGESAKEELLRPEVKGVRVETVKPVSVDEYYEASGTVKAKTVSVVAGRLMGAVTSLKVKEGDRVKKGQLLLTIDDRDVKAKVKAAEEGYKEALSALESAKRQKELADITYERFKKLYEEKALTEQELDQIKTKKKVAESEFNRVQAVVNRAKAALKEAKVYLSFTRVTSPVDGIVTEKKTDIGSMTAPGVPLLTIEDDSVYRIEVNVDEGLLGVIKPGMTAQITIESTSMKTEGKVVEIVPAVDPMTRTFLVKIELNGKGLRSGLYGKVKFPVGVKQAIFVPAEAVVEKGQLTGVYAVDEDGMVTYRLVRVGKQYEDMVEILSGITSGDRVIVKGVEEAIDGGVLKEVSEG